MARVALLAFALIAIAWPAHSEVAWVKDELRLNLRSGPGTQYRIKGGVGTGDRMTVLQRGEGWTKVQSPKLGEGWIPAGFLQVEPPAGVRLEKSEAQTAEFRAQLESISSRTGELETSNSMLVAQDAQQKAMIEQLERENFELSSGARWPEWITGAAILGIGMLMGAILQSVSGRRQRPRIRL